MIEKSFKERVDTLEQLVSNSADVHAVIDALSRLGGVDERFVRVMNLLLPDRFQAKKTSDILFNFANTSVPKYKDTMTTFIAYMKDTNEYKKV